MDRLGNWNQTFSGKKIYPLDARPEEIDIVDIAHALAYQCRYNGHCSRFYSIAEHSIWVSRYSPPDLYLEGLFHDAAEAYLGDITTPLKPFLNGFKQIEENLTKVIFQKYGLIYPIPSEIHRIDTAILRDEQAQLMTLPAEEWHSTTEPALGISVELGMAPERAYVEFLDRFWMLEKGHHE